MNVTLKDGRVIKSHNNELRIPTNILAGYFYEKVDDTVYRPMFVDIYTMGELTYEATELTDEEVEKSLVTALADRAEYWKNHVYGQS